MNPATRTLLPLLRRSSSSSSSSNIVPRRLLLSPTPPAAPSAPSSAAARRRFMTTKTQQQTETPPPPSSSLSSSTPPTTPPTPTPQPPKHHKVPVTWASLGLMAITGAGLTYYYQLEKEKKEQQALGKVTTYGKPALGGPWTLVDFNGKPVTDADFKGEFLLLYFGFTHCPDICPSELVKVGKILDQMDKERGLPMVRPVFISVDPDRDHVGQLRHYSQDFHPRILYLTGTKDQLAKVTKAYRVYFSKANEEDEENYLVDHSIVLYLIGPDGSFLDFFTQSMQPPDIVTRIKKYLVQARRVTT